MGHVYGVGIIGAGVIFSDHARSYESLRGRARLVGLAEVDVHKRQAAADRHFIPVLTEDYKTLLARDDIDIIDICTAPFLHEQMILDALSAGKHVVCEKPLAHTLESADRIIEASKHASGRLAVVYQLRYLGDVRRMIHLRDSGQTGRLLFGRFSRYSHTTGTDWWGRWGHAGGGAAMTQFVHELDLMHHIFGPACEVTAQFDTLKLPIESEDTFSAQIRFDSGAMATCFCTVAAPRPGPSHIDVIGEQLSVHMPWSVQATHTWDGLKARRQAEQAIPLTVGRSRFSQQRRRVQFLLGRFFPKLRPKPGSSDHEPYLKAFLDALDSDGPVPVSAQEARISLELCTAIYTSALTGKPVTLPLDSSTPYYKGITLQDYDGRERARRAGR